MMIRTTLTDDEITKLKNAIDYIHMARDILTDLAGPCYYTKGETRTMLREKFMQKALALNPMFWDLKDSYEGIMNYKRHTTKRYK